VNWPLIATFGAVVLVVGTAVTYAGVRAERRPDPAPERHIDAGDLPAVRSELVLRDVVLDRQQQRLQRQLNNYRNDRGDTL
jgi:hypothetical protein